jgi:peptide-methionine (S)-S-oxide reductase
VKAIVMAMLMACTSSATAEPGTELAAPLTSGSSEAIFAGGCFWCMEGAFDRLPGVQETWSGYTGGEERAPTYRQVSSGQTSHYEALRVVYDPQKVSLGQLLEVFWRNIDPTQADGQFCDKGKQYRSAVFVSDPKELSLVEDSRAAAAAKLGTAVVTQVLPKADFWLAEEYHQDFYQKKPEHYMRYRLGCGRDRRLLELWGRAGH